MQKILLPSLILPRGVSPKRRTSCGCHATRFRKNRGFSLVELMVVVALIVLVAGFATTGMKGLAEGSRLSKAIIGISGAMENARQAAIAQGTYTWVGMNNDVQNGQNIVTIATFASADGTRGDGASAANMKLISKVEQFEAVKLLKSQPSGNGLQISKLPPVGNPASPQDTAFKPTSKGLPSDRLKNDVFDWAVIFTPRGEACIDGNPASGASGADGDNLNLTQAIQMWISSSKGSAPNQLENKSASLIQVNGITGQVDVFHP